VGERDRELHIACVTHQRGLPLPEDLMDEMLAHLIQLVWNLS
jgi:hypothetical protein